MAKPPNFSAELIGNRLIVWDSREASELFKMGFYGKPVGISKPKSAEFDTPLVLDLIEGLYLLEEGLIRVYKESENAIVGLKKLKTHAKEAHGRFDLDYLVYKDLRKHDFVVLPGIKFGCEYAVYKRGPGIDHAPYMVSVKKKGENITSTEIVRAGRLATSVRKRFIIAIPNLNTGKVRYLMFKWFKA